MGLLSEKVARAVRAKGRVDLAEYTTVKARLLLDLYLQGLNASELIQYKKRIGVLSQDERRRNGSRAGRGISTGGRLQ